MTGFRCHKFNHKCADKGCYIEQLPWWCDLFEAFPRGIRATDVDGMVEINGNFLFLEEKSAGVMFSNNAGQFRAFKMLSRLPGVTVLWFRPGKSTDYEYLIHDGGEPHTGSCSKGQLVSWMSNWAKKADGGAAA